MVNYNCIRCGYATTHKSKMKKHLERKTLCKPLLNNINLEEYKSQILDCKNINLDNTSFIQQKYNKNTTSIQQKNNVSTTKIQQKHNNSETNNDKSLCQFCEKSFSFSQSLYRHLKICKEKKKNDEDKNNLLNLVEMLNDQLKEQREEFKKALNKRDEELSKRDNQIDELIKKAGITNNITKNIQQNIKLLAYNNTDISHLKDKDYLKCLNHSNMCIPHLIKEIHFNPEKPENHNIYISNLKNNFALVYDGSKWNLQNRNETVEDLINNNEDILEQKLEEWIENGNNFPEIMKKFNRYLEKKEHDVVLNKIKEEIKLILYNNRSLIKEIDI